MHTCVGRLTAEMAGPGADTHEAGVVKTRKPARFNMIGADAREGSVSQVDAKFEVTVVIAATTGTDTTEGPSSALPMFLRVTKHPEQAREGEKQKKINLKDPQVD